MNAEPRDCPRVVVAVAEREAQEEAAWALGDLRDEVKAQVRGGKLVGGLGDTAARHADRLELRGGVWCRAALCLVEAPNLAHGDGRQPGQRAPARRPQLDVLGSHQL
jgi:hypothetical protein